MVKIAFVSEHASPLATLGGVDAGGQNVHVAELASGLTRLGHDVTVYTRADRQDLPRTVMTPNGYQVIHLEAGPVAHVPKDDLWPQMPTFAARLEDALSIDPPDLVHAHFWMSGWAAVRGARRLRIRTVLTFHALGWVKRRHLGTADPSPRARQRVEPQLARSVDRIIATCTDEVAELARAHVPAQHISVVPCGVDLAHFSPNGPSLLPRRQTHRLVCVGRLVPRKGFDLAVRALAAVPDTELVIAGGDGADEPERARLLALAASLGVADRVRLLGQVSRADMPALLRSADVVVTAPWYEPFGIVPLEAMACGVPVVASAVGGMLDTVVPEITGLHVPPRDPDRLAAALRWLLAHPGTAKSYGRAGVARARDLYSWATIAARTAEVYEQTLARTEPGVVVLGTPG